MLWKENPVFAQMLGICSALAVTNQVICALVMGAGLTVTTAMSCVTVSLLRRYIPGCARMLVQVLLISTYVIILKIALDTWMPETSRTLGAYIGLIITNCIVMGRCEAFASANGLLKSAADGLGAGVGYSLALVIVACVREPLGTGMLCGYSIPWMADWTRWGIMMSAPGGFFVLAVVLWLVRVACRRIVPGNAENAIRSLAVREQDCPKIQEG